MNRAVERHLERCGFSRLQRDQETHGSEQDYGARHYGLDWIDQQRPEMDLPPVTRLIGSALAITSKDHLVLKQWVGHVPLFSLDNVMEVEEKCQFLISRIGLAAHPHGRVL